MKRINIIIAFLLLIIVVLSTGYFLIKSANKNNTGNYLGSYYKGNYVWGGAMNLAWNDLNENILDEKLKLNTEEKVALGMVEKFNDAVFEKTDLDEKSYYIKSGYGQETVDLINQESREKFPTKSFPDLTIVLAPTEIISYAYFLKEVEYLTQFKETNVKFENKDVKGFYTQSSEDKKNVKIVKYWNDNKFIINLRLKEEGDELFLAKGFDMTSPQDIVDEINKYNNESNTVVIGNDDVFKMPKIHLDHERRYEELINKTIANENFEEYFIGEMSEKIKFDMDHKGAKVENEALMGLPVGIKSKIPKHKKFILNEPFWIVMKRANSNNPYFILGVNNENIMERVK